MANEVIKLGMYIGVGGVVTFKNAKTIIDVVKNISLEKIVLETDAPYMAPVPHRGQRNEPAFVPAIISRLAEVYGTDEESIARETTKNALQVIPRMA